MVKVSGETRKAIMADKGKMTVKDLCAKYNLSKATVHRVFQAGTNPKVDHASIAASEPVEPPSLFETTTEEFSAVIDGPPTNEIIEAEAKQESKAEKDALDRLAAKLMETPLDDEMAALAEIKKSSRRGPKPKNVVFDIAPPAGNAGDDLERRNQLEQRIILNVDNFAPLFHFIKDKEQFVKSLHNKPAWELEGILKTLETTRTTVNLSNQIKQTFFMASRGVEVFGNTLLSLKLQGLTEGFVQQQQELDMIFREIAIEYAPMFKITAKPELRLAMIFAMTAVQTDSTNRLKEVMKAQGALRTSESVQTATANPEPAAAPMSARYADL